MAHVEFDEATLTTAEERASIHEESQCRKYLVDSPGPAYGGSRVFPKSLATWRTMTGAHRVIRGAEQSQRRASQWSASPRFAMAPGDVVKRVLLAHSVPHAVLPKPHGGARALVSLVSRLARAIHHPRTNCVHLASAKI